jgi:hypothetical protein
MASEVELARIAQVMNILRPSWPAQSCLTILRRHAGHPLCDLAVAAVAVAVDVTSTTPARLDQGGPWWSLARAEPTPTPPAYRDTQEPTLDPARLRFRAEECRRALQRAKEAMEVDA